MAAPESTPIPCFIDTNVWLYAFVDPKANNKHNIAKKTIQANEAIVSTQVINEICVNLLKKTELSEQDIRALILSFYSNYRVIELSPDVCSKPLNSANNTVFPFGIASSSPVLYMLSVSSSTLKICNPGCMWRIS